ncbi:hypothetical protein HNR74_002704 [Flammeovirga kamogawensis]|nr:hypothetical protein [Flammeovirga kamogawensis]
MNLSFIKNETRIFEILLLNLMCSLPWGFAYTNISFLLIILYIFIFFLKNKNIQFKIEYLPLFLLFMYYHLGFIMKEICY